MFAAPCYEGLICCCASGFSFVDFCPERTEVMCLHEVILLKDLWIPCSDCFVESLWLQAWIQQAQSSPMCERLLAPSTDVVGEFDLGNNTSIAFDEAISCDDPGGGRDWLVDHGVLACDRTG
jgi:hypothetical protein